MQVDHINHDKLDNRKLNLRICTSSQNSHNRNVKGISCNEEGNKCKARICFDGRQIHLGYFNTKEKAIMARRKAEKKYFGEFAYKGI